MFSACYDDLANELENTGVGILYKTLKKFILLCVIIYAEDILLIASSPHSLKLLINKTLSFAQCYNDITLNPDKSWILRLGQHQRPAVSVLGIPVTECYEYLGVEIGRKADQQKAATCKLYTQANKLNGSWVLLILFYLHCQPFSGGKKRCNTAMQQVIIRIL